MPTYSEHGPAVLNGGVVQVRLSLCVMTATVQAAADEKQQTRAALLPPFSRFVPFTVSDCPPSMEIERGDTLRRDIAGSTDNGRGAAAAMPAPSFHMDSVPAPVVLKRGHVHRTAVLERNHAGYIAEDPFADDSAVALAGNASSGLGDENTHERSVLEAKPAPRTRSCHPPASSQISGSEPAPSSVGGDKYVKLAPVGSHTALPSPESASL